jgi:photosystem II stability/assembly factor-like uncharacterized protein
MLRRLIASSALVALALTPNATAGVLVGHSGWEWSNPLPQGNSLRALDFEGGSGYAAGDFGTLLRSDDDGASWRALPTRITEDLTDVQAIGSESVVIAGGCALERSDDGGESFRPLRWTARPSSCKAPIASISFPSSDVGYVLLEDGHLYRSDDGGGDWSAAEPVPVPTPSNDHDAAASVVFTGADVGLATSNEGIYRTTDGGESWAPVAEHPDGFAGVYFADALTGYAAGAGGLVAKTTDGGVTWSSLPSASVAGSATLRSVHCLDPLRCLVTTQDGDRILRTSDGGASWASTPTTAGSALAAAFGSVGHAVAVGDAGAVSLSSDEAVTWSRIDTRIDERFTRLCGESGLLAFALGEDGRLARTTDAGRTWSFLTSPSSQDLVDVSFPDQATGFALDAAGTLDRTDDGGASWAVVYEAPSSLPQAVLAIDADHVLLVGSRGIQRSLDGGRTFAAVKRPAVRRSGLFDVDHAGGWLFAYGPTSMFASRDRGKTWRKLRRPDHRPLAVVDFVSARYGFALGKGGRVWRTRNQGRSWRELVGAGTDGSIDLAFSNAREGYLFARDLFFAKGSDRPDYVLRTTDGGATWRPQLVANSRDVNGLLATRDYVDFLLVGDNHVFVTTSGGDEGRGSSLRLRTQNRTVTHGRKVRIAGRLDPAETGQLVVVSRTEADPRARKGANDWSFKAVHVRSGGSFVTHWRLHRTSVFVAQWKGDGSHRGAGSRALEVRVSGH